MRRRAEEKRTWRSTCSISPRQSESAICSDGVHDGGPSAGSMGSLLALLPMKPKGAIGALRDSEIFCGVRRVCTFRRVRSTISRPDTQIYA